MGSKEQGARVHKVVGDTTTEPKFEEREGTTRTKHQQSTEAKRKKFVSYKPPKRGRYKTETIILLP